MNITSETVLRDTLIQMLRTDRGIREAVQDAARTKATEKKVGEVLEGERRRLVRLIQEDDGIREAIRRAATG